MGWRRFSIGSTSQLLRIQVRAPRAAAGRASADVSDGRRHLRVRAGPGYRAGEELSLFDYELPETIKLGVMIEVKVAVLFQLGRAVRQGAFLPRSPNDLFQSSPMPPIAANTRMTGR